MNPEHVKSIIAAVQMDQVLYDMVIRKSPYTKTPLIVSLLEDFFVHTMVQRLEMMFVPLENTKIPEQIGKVILTSMLKQTSVDRCRTLFSTYPCEFITDEDLETCRLLNFPPCSPKANPPPGYGYTQWEMMNSFVELVSYKRAYSPAKHEPSIMIKEQSEPLKRKKRSPMRGSRRRPGKKPGSSSSSKSSGSRGSGGRPSTPSRNVLMQLGAGTGVGAGLGAGKTRPGVASPGVFNTLSLHQIRRMNLPARPRAGSVSGTHSFTSGSGMQAVNPPPVALTNLRAKATSMDSLRPVSPLDKSSSPSLSGSSKVSTRGEVAVPQPVAAPRSGWQDMPPVDLPQYFIPKYKQRPVATQQRNLAGDRPLSRSSSTSSLESLDSSAGTSRSASRGTNEGGSFLPQVREDFKLHNRVGDVMRNYASQHPFITKAGKWAGTGLAFLGAYVAVSQIDRAIQKAQDEAEDKTAEHQKNVTDTLEADLLREKLANEKFKQQSEFASKVLSDAILTGQVPTALVESVNQRQPELPVAPGLNYGLWPEIRSGKDPIHFVCFKFLLRIIVSFSLTFFLLKM